MLRDRTPSESEDTYLILIARVLVIANIDDLPQSDVVVVINRGFHDGDPAVTLEQKSAGQNLVFNAVAFTDVSGAQAPSP
ncbi:MULTISPECIES: hypothetical protein [Streptomyces]|uniref:hypothetical protein n=1 Tax=Streptomyces TaxID=1883 RepID=UPI0013DF8536|nr:MULTISPECIES: hypothetical protein [Streptomyces]MCX4615489.1 hypothetical protein [Streptomyces mirabilis]MCX5355994.1 hypothetical protein [Streptomyces mirabilis]